MIDLTTVIGLILEMGAKASQRGWQRRELVMRVLKRLDFTPDVPLNDFAAIYTYTLVEYGAFKPAPILNFFRHPFIQSAYRRAFYRQDWQILERETEGIIQWNKENQALGVIGQDPRREIIAFSALFFEVVRQSRTPVDVLLATELAQVRADLGERLDLIMRRLEQLEELNALREEVAVVKANLLRQQHPAVQMVPKSHLNFVGRGVILEKLQVALRDRRGQRVIAIQGMAGVGKTAVVVAAAKMVSSMFQGGIFWASLAEFQGAAGAVVRTWLRACGQEIPDNVQSLSELLEIMRFVLWQRQQEIGPLLIVIDDARHEWRETVRQLQQICPSACQILLTLRNEMSIPNGAEVYGLQPLSDDEAFDLLKLVAGEAAVGKDRAAAQALLNTIGNLPLAIHLIGNQLKRLSQKPGYDVGNLHQAIQAQPNSQLVGNAQLNATFMVSYLSLSAEGQRLFRWLGLFASPRLNIRHVTGVTGLDRDKVEGLLDYELVPSALLTWDEQEEGIYVCNSLLHTFARTLLLATENRSTAEPDVAILPTLRSLMVEAFSNEELDNLCFDFDVDPETFTNAAKGNKARGLISACRQRERLMELVLACAKLRPHKAWPGVSPAKRKEGAASELERAIRQYVAHYMVFVQEAAENVAGWDTLEIELNNILLAVERTIQGEDRASLAVFEGFLVYQEQFLNIRAYYQEALQLLEQAVALDEKLGNQGDLVRGLNIQAFFLMRLGKYIEATEKAGVGYKLAVGAADLTQQAMSLRYRGMATFYLGDYELALALFQEEAVLWEDLDERRQQASTLVSLGKVQISRSFYREAVGYFEQAVDIFRQVDDPLSLAATISNRAATYLFLGNYADARKGSEDGLALSREMVFREYVAQNLLNLGIIAHHYENYAESFSRLEESLTHWQAMRSHHDELLTLLVMADVYISLGQIERASHYLELTYLLFGEDTQDSLVSGDVELERAHVKGMVTLAQGWVVKAHEQFSLLHTLSEKRDSKFFLALAKLGIVQVFIHENKREGSHRARQQAQAAIGLCQQWELAGLEPRGWVYLGKVVLLEGDVEAAYRHCQRALELLERQQIVYGSRFEIYLHALQVLAAGEFWDDRWALLQTAYEQLSLVAAKIEDDGMRRAFLTAPIQVTIGAIWEQVSTSKGLSNNRSE